nr:MAG TPA: putative DNA-binding domain protein [Caudoviricetes sp.]
MRDTIIRLLDDLTEAQLKIVYWTILGVSRGEKKDGP